MYSYLRWFVEGQANHNPWVAGSSPAAATFHRPSTYILKPVYFPGSPPLTEKNSIMSEVLSGFYYLFF
jgi:hypothetical protein